MKIRLFPVLGWGLALSVLLFATLVYDPGLTEAGQLLVWLDEAFYTVSLDGAHTVLIAETGRNFSHEASPGCFGSARAPCWIQYNTFLQRVPDGPRQRLPLQQNDFWINSTVSWSPDGFHLVYTVANRATGQTELRLVNAFTLESQTLAGNADPSTKPVWSRTCALAYDSPQCHLAYRESLPREGASGPRLVALTPSLNISRTWIITGQIVPTLAWLPDDRLIYSRNSIEIDLSAVYAGDQSPVVNLPDGRQATGALSRANRVVYYEDYRTGSLSCKLTNLIKADACQRRGIWLSDYQGGEPRLIYSVEAGSRRGGYNAGPIWSPNEEAFIMFDEGRVIYRDANAQRTEIWYEGVRSGPRARPVFSPDGQAVALVIGGDPDTVGSGGQLLIAGHRIKPVILNLESKKGLRVIAWLPPEVDLY